jgi:hypothetical protein
MVGGAQETIVDRGLTNANNRRPAIGLSRVDMRFIQVQRPTAGR